MGWKGDDASWCEGCKQDFVAHRYKCEDCKQYTICNNHRCNYCQYCQEYKEI